MRRSDDEVVLVLAEDFEDVNGMARQVGVAADLVDASFLALTGDLTFAGLAVETYIIDTVDYYSTTGRSTSPRAPRHGGGGRGGGTGWQWRTVRPSTPTG